jgi:hypothetical protein
VFLIYEELSPPVDGKPTPTARKDLSEFLQDKRRPFIRCFHVIAVHPTAQVYLVRDLHNTVHGGLLRPAIKLFLRAVTDVGTPHMYYGASVGVHANGFLRVMNGPAVTRLKSFRKLNFAIPMSKVNTAVVGSRWNSQYTWGVASMNFKKSSPGDLVNAATLKVDNVTDCILPQFCYLTELLLEVDINNEFYCGLVAGNERRQEHAQRLMEEDPLLPKYLHDKNVIESVSGICNVYSTDNKGNMFAGADGANFGAIHSNGGGQKPAPKKVAEKKESKKKQEKMKEKFAQWGIDLKWVILFPHIDDFNARQPGQNFLGSVSKTVLIDRSGGSRRGYVTKQRQTMTFCQRKVHEDAGIREACARTIHDSIRIWREKLPKYRTGRGIVEFSWDIRQHLKTDELTYRATNENKCLYYYSIFCSDHRKVADHFQLGLVRQVESLGGLIFCNGPHKHHKFFQHLLDLDELPSEPLPAQFISYCNRHEGGSVMSVGKGIRHRPHWMKPYLKAEMMYGLRVLLSIIEDANSGELTREETLKCISREVKYAGDLVANHLLGVAVLSGLLLPREYLTIPRVALTLCNKVRKTLFNDDKTMTNIRISKGVELASESLGIHMLVGEHGLCETVRETKGSAAGHDAFHKDQDFVWISDETRNNGKITEIRCNSKKAKYRTEDYDRKAYYSLLRVDSNYVTHRWWEPKATSRTECLVHFVKECLGSNSDPLEVLYSSANAKDNSGDEEKGAMWRKYIDQHKIDVDRFPHGMRHLQSSNQSNSKSVRAEGKITTEMRKGYITSTTKPKKVGKLIGKKRKNRGNEDKNLDSIHDKKTIVSSRDSRPKEKKREGPSAEVVLYESKETPVVPVDLHRDALNALKERFGKNTPKMEGFGASYKKLGFVWIHHLRDGNQTSVDPIVEYPPSVLDRTSITLPDNNGKGWTKKNDSYQALCWWIICNVTSVHNRREWAEEKLKDNASAVLLVGNKLWCMISRQFNGSFCVEYNGRKIVLA